MKNRFFELATRQAARLLGKPGRMKTLLLQFAGKLNTVKWGDLRVQNFQDKFLVMGRLARAYVMGDYREIPWKTMLTLVAALLYFVNPLDLIPDVIPVTGLTDDFAVLVWAYNAIRLEIDKFLAWEKTRELGQ
jgi:uncharacterized membrane protein YkvA (DUF1232 family)